MAAVFALVALMWSIPTGLAVDQQMAANPVRKVVNMLQNMQKKIEAEGKKEAELYDKFLCYCKNSGGDLSQSIADADAKVPALASSIKEAESKKKQLDEDIKAHQSDRSRAKAAMAEATGIREKDASAFAKQKSDYSANMAALKKGLAAVEAGTVGSFLQTGTAQLLKALALNKEDLQDADRQDILAFLSGTQSDFTPQSGEIVGILKSISDDMAKSSAASEKAEAAAVSQYDDLMAVKKKQVDLSTQSIETKHVRVGELAVDVVEMKDDLTDTDEQLLQDKKFLADLGKNCATQTTEWEERQQTRSDELLALADTIKLLNDDEALELFKKTLPSGSASLLQVAVGTATIRKSALVLLQGLQSVSTRATPHRAQLDFITLALRGKPAAGFSKVTKMIDAMVKTLQQEQLDDSHRKEYCAKQFDFTESKRKGLQKTVSDLEIFIDESKEGMATLASEIKALTAGIRALDKSVAEATEQRQSEHEDYTELVASDVAAKELLQFAVNRLNKFYNPRLYNPGSQASTGVSFAQISAHSLEEDSSVVPPAPATPDAYSKKSEDSGGVIAMIELLAKDLGKEMDKTKQAEKDAQSEYEDMLEDAAKKRAVDSKSLTEKNAARAALESDAQADTDSKVSAGKELMATEKYMASLHAQCDWLLQYFDVRAEARTSEIDSLEKAKSVLNGADLSLLQKKSARTPQRAFMQPRA